MICKKHPNYKGAYKPRTKLTEEDGCSCHEFWNRSLVVENHVVPNIELNKEESLYLINTLFLKEKIYKFFKWFNVCDIKDWVCTYYALTGSTHKIYEIDDSYQEVYSSASDIIDKIGNPKLSQLFYAVTIGRQPERQINKPNVYEENVHKVLENILTVQSTLKYKQIDQCLLPNILLYGPPGTGKSSFMGDEHRVSAHELDMLDDIIDNISYEKNRNIYLIIDEVDKIGKNDNENMTKLLRILDQRDFAVLLTSNKDVKDLPKPLTRPGRIDQAIKIDFLSEKRVETLFKNLFGDLATKAKKAYDLTNFKENDKIKVYQPSAVRSMQTSALRTALVNAYGEGIENKEKDTKIPKKRWKFKKRSRSGLNKVQKAI